MNSTSFRDRIKGLRRVHASDLIPHPMNWRRHPESQREALRGVLSEVGIVDVPICRELPDGRLQLLDGHLRQEVLGESEISVLVLDIADDTEAAKVLATLDPIAAMAEASTKELDQILRMVDTGSAAVQEMLAELADSAGLYQDEKKEVEEDDPPEPPVEPITKPGDLWVLGDHRLLCGDSTKAEDVERLMDGEKAELCHADPPYGMGKESDGVVNDNLYDHKLDKFQIEWWRTFRPHLFDNASVYVWGNAPDLWRLWYSGGLSQEERMTIRNEIVWDKGGGGMAVGTESGRMFQSSERCLFFMLGEQGFNNNANNYWDGWDFVVDYLREEKEKTGWDIRKFKRLAGHSETSGCHWFDKSQWMFPTKEVYESWQKAAQQHDAFVRPYDELKRQHDELKREFYETRSYFDNTHDNMTDIWSFGRVKGEHRHGHATPKPVEMIARAIMSSSRSGAVVVEPFLGSGTTLIAAEQLGRKCYGMEISPAYCDVIVARWEKLTGSKAVLENTTA